MPNKTLRVELTVRQFCALRDALAWDLGATRHAVFQKKTPNRAQPGKTNYHTMYFVEGSQAALHRLVERAPASPMSVAARNALRVLRAALAPVRR